MMRRPLPVLLLASAVLLFSFLSGMAADTFPTLVAPSVLTAKSLGSAMLAVTRAGDRLVAVGERGIVLLSDDDGRSWRQVVTPVRVSLTTVTFVGEKKGWAAGHLGVILHTEDGGESWVKQFDGIRAAALVLAAAEQRAAAEPDPEKGEDLLFSARRLVADGPDKRFLDLCFLTTWAFMPAITAGNKAVLDRFAPDFCGTELKMGCFAMTEPGGSHGGGGCDIENPTLKGKKIRTMAKLEGDEWVINGQKMWASNAGDADVYCVLCTTDPNLGDDGIALIYVPADAKGLSFGKDENKAGMQGDRNCPMYLDDVRVPKAFRAAGPGADAHLMHGNVVAARILTGALAVGNAVGAFETVLKFTEERIVADRPVRQHSICAGMLADMAIGIETARAYCLNAAYMFEHPEIYGPPFSDTMLSRASIAKVYAADVAVMVANKAMELMGSYGYVREYNVEKYWRDCKIIQMWEGGGQLGRFDVCRGYYDCQL